MLTACIVIAYLVAGRLLAEILRPATDAQEAAESGQIVDTLNKEGFAAWHILLLLLGSVVIYFLFWPLHLPGWIRDYRRWKAKG